MTPLQPRPWWDSIPDKVNPGFYVGTEARKLFPFVDVKPMYQVYYERLNAVTWLLDNEELLEITRNDWIFVEGMFFFTSADQALLFKLTFTP